MSVKRFLSLVGFCAFMAACPLHAQFVINEYSVSNLSTVPDNYNKYEDWIEIYNMSGQDADIGGYFISDNPDDNRKWAFPESTLIGAGGYLVVWASGRDEAIEGHFHTNFRLSQTTENPEWIVFSTPSGTIMEEFPLAITQDGHSRGRVTDAGPAWGIFKNPTPESSNNASTAYSRYAEKPSVSVPAGFYTEPFTVTLTTNEVNAQIKYTLDGTEPIASSPTYTGPIDISSTLVLKARVFSNFAAVLPGLIEFDTYFLNEDHVLPVMSVASDHMLELLNGNETLRPQGSAEFFNQDKVRTTTAYGEFNEHGQDSWVHPQRSIDYIARDECGYNKALYEKFFSLSDREEFQRVILRASGDDNYPGIDTSSHLRDDFVQTLSQKAGQKLDWRKSERVVLYANGVYWGIYAIREKVPDHDYTDYYYSQGKYDLQYILLWGGTWAEYGGDQALEDWYTLYNYIISHDMSDPENYHTVTDQYDITSLVDYVIINSYVVCSDWLNWNVGWWRGLNPQGTHRKWAYILWDEDATFGHYINYTGIPAQSPYVSPCYQDDLAGWQDPENHVVILNKLRENADFEQYYISRYIDLLNTTFNDDYMIPMLDSMAQIIASEIPRHTVRWGGSPEEWQTNVQKIRDFIITRNTMIWGGLADCYNLLGPYDIVVDLQPSGAGQVQVNSLSLTQYPWTGSYFSGIDVKLRAIEVNPGYEFDRWILNNHEVLPSDSAKEVSLALLEGDSIVALFRPRIFTDSLVINEINYNAADNFDPGDWVEFYNPHNYSLDITDWIFKDEDDQHIYAFPPGTMIESWDYLVVCEDKNAFANLFPQVPNYVGNMDFGLSGSGELIRLFDASGTLIDTVHYDDKYPWPTAPDGNGPTLELIHPALDNALASSWCSYFDHGTPGMLNECYVGIPSQPPAEVLMCRVWPNPVTDRAIVSVTTDHDLQGAMCILCDMFGQELKQIRMNGSQEFSISRDNLPGGLYIFKIIDSSHNHLYTGKFIIL
ncbi:MAG: lamin tail domain-containing protein [Bacteroidales bacterium]|nr:lamin tail domain-containing protein [Lentimicrobiaceae bacterium]MDD5693979.1 lamin tail domain-containing protein [Bacteroidales bacterium]